MCPHTTMGKAHNSWAFYLCGSSPSGCFSVQSAHLVACPFFMPPSAVLVEGVPWAMAAYEGQPTITIHSDVHHVRVYSSRPPALQPAALRHGLADSTEARCAADEVCKRRYRDHANIYVREESVVALLRAHLVGEPAVEDDDVRAQLGRLLALEPLRRAQQLVVERDDQDVNDLGDETPTAEARREPDGLVVAKVAWAGSKSESV